MIPEEMEMFRCLGYAFEKKKVEVWPVWLCRMETVNTAVELGWLNNKERQPLIPRWGMSRVVYSITDTGSRLYYQLLGKYDVEKRTEKKGS